MQKITGEPDLAGQRWGKRRAVGMEGGGILLSLWPLPNAGGESSELNAFGCVRSSGLSMGSFSSFCLYFVGMKCPIGLGGGWRSANLPYREGFK